MCVSFLMSVESDRGGGRGGSDRVSSSRVSSSRVSRWTTVRSTRRYLYFFCSICIYVHIHIHLLSYIYTCICIYIYMYRNIWAGFDLVSGGGRKGEGEIRLTNLASCKSEIKFYRGWKVREARKVASQSTYIKLLLTRNLHRLPTPPHSTSIIVVTNCLFQESLGAIKRGFPILGDDSFRWCLFFRTFSFFSNRFRESII